MTRLTDDALAELARLAGEATPGPWRTVVKGNTVQFLAIEGVCSGISPKTRNGPFIAAANPATVAALVAEVRALRAEVERQFGLEIALRADLDQALRHAGGYAAEVQRLRAATDELWRLALRAHVECDDCWYSCPKSEGGTCNEEWHDGECRCGADAHNARVASIRAALDGAE